MAIRVTDTNTAVALATGSTAVTTNRDRVRAQIQDQTDRVKSADSGLEAANQALAAAQANYASAKGKKNQEKAAVVLQNAYANVAVARQMADNAKKTLKQLVETALPRAIAQDNQATNANQAREARNEQTAETQKKQAEDAKKSASEAAKDPSVAAATKVLAGADKADTAGMQKAEASLTEAGLNPEEIAEEATAGVPSEAPDLGDAEGTAPQKGVEAFVASQKPFDEALARNGRAVAETAAQLGEGAGQQATVGSGQSQGTPVQAGSNTYDSGEDVVVKDPAAQGTGTPAPSTGTPPPRGAAPRNLAAVPTNNASLPTGQDSAATSGPRASVGTGIGIDKEIPDSVKAMARETARAVMKQDKQKDMEDTLTSFISKAQEELSSQSAGADSEDPKAPTGNNKKGADKAKVGSGQGATLSAGEKSAMAPGGAMAQTSVGSGGAGGSVEKQVQVAGLVASGPSTGGSKRAVVGAGGRDQVASVGAGGTGAANGTNLVTADGEIGKAYVGGISPMELVQMVMLMAFQEAGENVRSAADTLQVQTNAKKNARDKIASNRPDVSYDDAGKLTSDGKIANDTISSVEGNIDAIGDDNQILMIRLQNLTQLMTTMSQAASNVSKNLYDTEKSVIGQIGH